MRKFYTADCVNDRGLFVGNCIVTVYFWRSAKFAYDKISQDANEYGVKTINFRRVR